MCNHKVTRSDRSCLHCGKSPITGYKYCGEKCRSVATRRRKGIRSKADYRASLTRKTIEFVCEWCGKKGVKSPKNTADGKTARFCNRRCAITYNNIQRDPIKWAAKQRICVKVYRSSCQWCGNRFSSKAHNSAFCSKRCGYMAASKKREWRPHRKNCVECGIEFWPLYGFGRWDTCTDHCADQREKHRRRVRKARDRALLAAPEADKIDPIAVFERDGWRCQLCGKPTPRQRRGSYRSNAPELDHIQPLSAGGSHTWDNVQCACRQCNGEKAATPRGQLQLFSQPQP